MRCKPPCGKVIFTAEYIAMLAAIRIALNGEIYPWYKSGACKCWHLTSHGRDKSKVALLKQYLPKQRLTEHSKKREHHD